MNLTITDPQERFKFEQEDTLHQFFRTRAFEEFVLHHADELKKRDAEHLVEATLKSYGLISCNIIDGQLINIRAPFSVREKLSEIIFRLRRDACI